jgi:REP-associated tyrosine transposase
MYNWRKLTETQRREALALRRGRKLPWHSPPHLNFEGVHSYLISSACFEHAPIVGRSPERMTQCETDTLDTCNKFCLAVNGWCILPDHYHLVITTERIKELLHELGLFHGRSSFIWNGEDECRGRQVWYNSFERPIKSERHFWATLNYVHHNPVHHGYVEHWQDWPWSSAAAFLEEVGRDKAKEIWKQYPVLDYGKKWDL